MFNTRIGMLEIEIEVQYGSSEKKSTKDKGSATLKALLQSQ